MGVLFGKRYIVDKFRKADYVDVNDNVISIMDCRSDENLMMVLVLVLVLAIIMRFC